LPGTAEMLFLTEKKIQTVAEFFQPIPFRLCVKGCYEFSMELCGVIKVYYPEWCGVIKNIQYRGGLIY
jgi:hypothetical protein